jgi:hypothetical protein
VINRIKTIKEDINEYIKRNTLVDEKTIFDSATQ